MKVADRHYKFINSKTSNAIAYHTIKVDLSEEKVKQVLEGVKNQVATKNQLLADTIYWEEVKEEE